MGDDENGSEPVQRAPELHDQSEIEANGGRRLSFLDRVVDGHGVAGVVTVTDQRQDPMTPDTGCVQAVSQGPGLALGSPGHSRRDDVQDERLSEPSFFHRHDPFRPSRGLRAHRTMRPRFDGHPGATITLTGGVTT